MVVLMAKQRRHRKKPDEPSQEEQWAEHRRRARPPEWWSNYSKEELDQMHAGGERLVEQGYGAADPEFESWLVEL